MSSAADVAVGIVIRTTTFTFNYEVLDVNLSGMEVPDIDISYQGTTAWREFKPADLADPGELSLTVHHNPDVLPPLRTTGTIEVDWPNNTEWSAGGYLKSYTASAPLNDKMTAEAVFKFSGIITVTTS